jgi:hypothetical protein
MKRNLICQLFSFPLTGSYKRKLSIASYFLFSKISSMIVLLNENKLPNIRSHILIWHQLCTVTSQDSVIIADFCFGILKFSLLKLWYFIPKFQLITFFYLLTFLLKYIEQFSWKGIKYQHNIWRSHIWFILTVQVCFLHLNGGPQV